LFFNHFLHFQNLEVNYGIRRDQMISKINSYLMKINALMMTLSRFNLVKATFYIKILLETKV